MREEWGVVTAAPKKGISVVMNLEGLQKIHIAPESIACHVRGIIWCSQGCPYCQTMVL
ncbi:hypothetical protein [Enterocloster bolteae]|uniref:hypothetical protein n=1 Tax=Enterocloster bolteae TaxID=208479 RepID=UPI00189E1C02|nr:hypothetical protein [Enterocloster bolteae]